MVQSETFINVSLILGRVWFTWWERRTRTYGEWTWQHQLPVILSSSILTPSNCHQPSHLSFRINKCKSQTLYALLSAYLLHRYTIVVLWILFVRAVVIVAILLEVLHRYTKCTWFLLYLSPMCSHFHFRLLNKHSIVCLCDFNCSASACILTNIPSSLSSSGSPGSARRERSSRTLRICCEYFLIWIVFTIN